MFLFVQGVLILACIALIARIAEGSWLSPGALFALLWSWYSLTALLFRVPSETLILGIVWIAGSGVLMHLGCLWGTGSQRVENQCEDKRFIYPYLRAVTGTLVFIGLVRISYIILDGSPSLGEALSVENLSQIVMQNRATFVYGSEKLTLIERVLFVAFYAAPLFGGILFQVAVSNMDKAIAVLAVIAPAAHNLLYGSRMGAMFGGAFWISAYMAARLLGGWNGKAHSDVSNLRALICIAVAIVGTSLVVLSLRYGDEEVSTLSLLLLAASDIFSFLPSFAILLDKGTFSFSDLTYGDRTFGRIFEFARLGTEDHYIYEAVDVGYTSSNVYTVFQGLIDDFGHIGALVSALIFGYIAGHSYQRVLRGKVVAVPFLTAVYAAVMISFSFSLFTYTSTTLALISFGLYIVLMAKEVRPDSSLDSSRLRLSPHQSQSQ